MAFITETDAVLNQFYDGRFVASAVSSKCNKLEANMKRILHEHFPAETSSMLVRRYRNGPKARPEVVKAALELFQMDFSEIENAEVFQKAEVLLSTNLGRALPLIPDERIFQVYILMKNVQSKKIF